MDREYGGCPWLWQILMVLFGCAGLFLGCATMHNGAEPPSLATAQSVWTSYWSAIEHDDVVAWNRTVHSSLRTAGVDGFDPAVRADARSFLTLCSVLPETLALGGDRASYRTRCAEGRTESGLFPAAGAEIVLRRDVDGAWRFFCFGCGLPYVPTSKATPPSPVEAQRLWVAFWGALERRDLEEAQGLLHTAQRRNSTDLTTAEMAGEARGFLHQCSVQSLPPVVAGDRARYKTRCLPDGGGGGDMVLGRDEDGVWRVVCFGGCPP
jgi:hypothetical protein